MRRLTLPLFVFVLQLLASPWSALQAKSFIRTDVNQNGRLDFADPLRALDYLMSGAPAPGCIDAIDSNDDGRTDVSDVILSLIFLFAEGPTPPAPYPGCGEDPTADGVQQERGRDFRVEAVLTQPGGRVPRCYQESHRQHHAEGADREAERLPEDRIHGASARGAKLRDRPGQSKRRPYHGRRLL